MVKPAYCPHCELMIARSAKTSFPVQPQRCPHCRLLIGVGRARTTPGEAPRAGAAGSAAGVLANAARRDEDAAAVDPEDVFRGFALVAGENGCRVGRLRMLDYQVALELNDRLPSLAAVLATFGSWKAARHEAEVAVRPALEAVPPSDDVVAPVDRAQAS